MTLAKINSSSTSSSKGGKRSSSPPSPRRQKSSSAASSSLSSFAAKKKQMKEKKESFQESEKICYINKAGRSGSLAPTMVKLHGILNVISHDNVVDAMERFGKTKSVVLFRSKREALVCFEREEDAKELKSYKTLNVNGFLVTIIRDEASQEQNKLHQKPELSVGSAEAPAAAPNNLRKKYLKESDSEEAGPDRAAAEETPKDSEMTTKTPQEESAPDPGGPTVGELLHQRLNPGMICCRKIKNCFTEKFAKTNLKLLMVTNLPVCGGGGGGGSGYTEGDVARLLKKFGFEHKEESMFVLPQTRMAFFMMPTTEKLQRMLVLCRRSPLWFRGCQLCLHVVASGISMSLFGFYKSLMKVVKVRVTDNGVRTVYARNISQSETRHLRAALTKIGGVRNFLPLLNRVYVEFKAVRDADRFGVWYSQQDPVPRYQITRLMTPNSCSPLPPKLLKQHLNSEDVTEATVTMTGSAVPQGSIAPFWITLKTSPFVFPTVSPWFKHPEYLTISEKSDVEKASLMAPTFPTVVMVTGLPEGNYKQQDVAKLVWPYFSKQDIYAVYYHVMVLTLQRRAFVYFTDWGKCCEFVNDHLTNPLCVHGNKLTLHFLLQRIHPKYSEDVMYRTLMEWSNTPVLEPDSLEERLLSAYIFHTTVDVVKQLMEVVASIAPVVNFVPLANRICIEMANANAARKVLDECCYYFPANTKQRLNWNLVGDIESVKSFRKRLQDSSHIRILLNSEPASNQPHAADNAASTASTAAPSAAAVSKMDEVKQEESEVPMETDAVPEAAKRKEPATSSEFNSAAALLTSSKTEAQLPHMNKDIFRILTAAVRQHRLIQEDQDQGRALAEDDFTSDNFSSDAYMFESQEFNMDDFVTVDEIGEVEDANSKSHIIASSTPSSRSTREGKGVSSTARHVSAKTSGDSSSPSSSSKDTKSSQRPAACYSAAAGMKKTRTGSVQASKEAKTHPESLRAAESDHAVSEPTNTGPASGGSEGLRSAPAFPLESGFNENICLKKRLGKIIKKDEVENFQVLDSLAEQKGDERNDGGQDGGSELQRSPPQESQTSHVETFQVLDSVEDEDKTSMENSNKMEAGGSFMLLDGVKEDQEETQLKDEIPASTESVQDVSKASRSQISNENQLPEHSKDAVKESDWATGEEDTFEIVDSIEDQTASEDDGQTLETPNDQNADEDIQPTGEDEGPAKRSVASKPASNNEARLPKTSKTCEMEDGDTGVQTKDKEVTEETVYEIIDSVEEEAATTREESGRRRSSRRKKEEKLTNQPEAPEKVDKDKEATYKILDSVEDEAVNDDEVALRRSTRGRKGRTKTEETSTRKRQIPARDSKERNAEKTPKKEDKVSLKESPSTKKSEASEEEEEATYQILDSVEDEAVQEEPPAAEKKGRKRRRKDEIAPHIYKPAKKIELLKTPEEEEEPLYQVVDSLEDDQVQENLTTADEPDGGKTERGETEDKVSPKQEAASAKAETPTRTSDENGVVKEINGRAATAGRSALMKLDAAAAADVSREERASPCGQTDAEIAEDDLLTLDEIVDEEEEEPKTPELHPQRQEDESVHSLKPETLMTVGALSIDEEEKLDEEGEMSKPAKRRDSRDECETFVTVDETGKEEEEEEVLTPRTRGRAKKRCRQSPAVRKSSRGKKERTREEEEKKPPPTSLCSSFSLEQPEPPGSTEPEAKRPRAAAFRLPPFRPNNPLGLEFLVPKFGFFCNVCSEFFLLEKISKELHCSSQTHYHNLEKYFQKLQQTSLSSPTQSSVTGSASE
ncbi:hypothetical protein LDENG_00209640 [Lucifuga dentata]|nr:hypothetical protein LDENG_00209640 [Lucifuga dentata]